ncbi:MAG: flagellar hook-basal body complex protein [Candidatus Margulisiibacteriota bacterium]|jgi:flagellar hook protein FlgE
MGGMFDIITSAKGAIGAYNEALRIHSLNIANMQVPGYKQLSTSFQSVFEQVLSRGTEAQGNIGGTNPKQLGQGVTLSGVTVNFSKGETTEGTNLSLAIDQEEGMFIISPDGGKRMLYTRSGDFKLDSNRNLTSNGMQVYGLDSGGRVVPIAGLPSGNVDDYEWKQDGYLYYQGTSTGYQIALTYFANPGGLAQAQGTAFEQTLASGDAAIPTGPGGVVGSVTPKQVEQSNVFYLAETIDTLEIQRAMSGNLNMVKMASDVINSFIQKLG